MYRYEHASEMCVFFSLACDATRQHNIHRMDPSDYERMRANMRTQVCLCVCVYENDTRATARGYVACRLY